MTKEQVLYEVAQNAALGREGRGLSGEAAAYRNLTGDHHHIRLASHWRLFCKCLGFGPEVFKLGPRALDALRRSINWNYRTGEIDEVGPGLNRRMALKTVRQRLELEEQIREMDGRTRPEAPRPA